MRDSFGLGDGKSIPVVDAFGLALASTKALARKVHRLEEGFGLTAPRQGFGLAEGA